MTVRTFNERSAQRYVPTFVTAAGGILSELESMGGLHTKDEFGMSELTMFIGHLNMLWLVVVFGNKTDVISLADSLRGVGHSYHLTDKEVAEWQGRLRDFATNPPHIDRLVAYFDRIIEPTAQIAGGDSCIRAQNWLLLLRDIGESYNDLLENPKWIAALDAALDRA